MALKALKKKKNFEKQLTEVDNTLSTIELQREDLENVGTTSTVLQVMKTARDALQKANLKLYVPRTFTVLPRWFKWVLYKTINQLNQNQPSITYKIVHQYKLIIMIELKRLDSKSRTLKYSVTCFIPAYKLKYNTVKLRTTMSFCRDGREKLGVGVPPQESFG